jgi:hypothetical protein
MTTSDPREFWEQWAGSTTPPQSNIQRGAKVRVEAQLSTVGRDLLGGPITAEQTRRWITFTIDRDGATVTVDMPDNAPTKSCDEQRHDDCAHRLGGRTEGGVQLKAGLGYFVWRCGCVCHRDPSRAGRLF